MIRVGKGSDTLDGGDGADTIRSDIGSDPIIPVDDDRGGQVEAGDPVLLSFPGSSPQFPALVEVDCALEDMVRALLRTRRLISACFSTCLTGTPARDR